MKTIETLLHVLKNCLKFIMVFFFLLKAANLRDSAPLRSAGAISGIAYKLHGSTLLSFYFLRSLKLSSMEVKNHGTEKKEIKRLNLFTEIAFNCIVSLNSVTKRRRKIGRLNYYPFENGLPIDQESV